MNKEESIEQLRAETERLQNQLGQYQQQLKLLQQRIDSLEHPGRTIKPTSPVLRQNSRREISFENFIGLRLIHLVGIVILVIGLSIGVNMLLIKTLFLKK